MDLVAFRKDPKGWIDSKHMCEWINDGRMISRLPLNCMCAMYIDKCSINCLKEEAFPAGENIRTDLCYFSANTTDWNHPCDYSVIKKIKNACLKRWDEQKFKLIRNNAWTEGRRLPNPGKPILYLPEMSSMASTTCTMRIVYHMLARL